MEKKNVECFCLKFKTLCSYITEEYEELINYGWRKFSWKAQGGYANMARQEKTQGKENRCSANDKGKD